jgi:uncharacterized protein involved in exopolysaccharide biosynthesis
MTTPTLPAERSLAELTAALVQRRVALLRAAGIAGAATLAIVLSQPRVYSSGFAVFPRMAGAGASGLSSLAAQFGLSVPGVDLTQSPMFYAEFATSPEVLRPLIDSLRDDAGHRIPLADVLGIAGGTPAEREAAMIDALAEAIHANVSAKSGLVRIRVVTSDPQVSTVIATRLLALLQETTIRMHQQQAGADQDFGSKRLVDAKADLFAAEAKVSAFAVRNRLYAQDPEGVVAYARLQRDVQFKQSIVEGLAQSVAQADVDHKRDTPVLGVVENVRPPLISDRRYAIVKSAAAALAAVLLTAAIVLLGSGGQPPLPPQDAWRSVRLALGGDLRRPWRLLLAVLTGRRIAPSTPLSA